MLNTTFSLAKGPTRETPDSSSSCSNESALMPNQVVVSTGLSIHIGRPQHRHHNRGDTPDEEKEGRQEQQDDASASKTVILQKWVPQSVFDPSPTRAKLSWFPVSLLQVVKAKTEKKASIAAATQKEEKEEEEEQEGVIHQNPPTPPQEGYVLTNITVRRYRDIEAEKAKRTRHYYIALNHDRHKLETLMDLYETCAELGQTLIMIENRHKAVEVGRSLLSNNYQAAYVGRSGNWVSAGNEAFVLATRDQVPMVNSLENVALVLNYDLPKDSEEYRARCRLCGDTGKKRIIMSFVTDDEDEIKWVKQTESAMSLDIEELPMDFAEGD